MSAAHGPATTTLHPHSKPVGWDDVADKLDALQGSHRQLARIVKEARAELVGKSDHVCNRLDTLERKLERLIDVISGAS